MSGKLEHLDAVFALVVQAEAELLRAKNLLSRAGIKDWPEINARLESAGSSIDAAMEKVRVP